MPESLGPVSTFVVLYIGLLFGLKHATEVDHVVAVSTIVSQHRNVWRSSLVGALWGAGHTASLLIIGIFVLTVRVAIPERVSNWLEFCVALMIIGLGASALWRALRKRGDVHVHEHRHDGVSHTHVHFHEPQTKHDEKRVHSHAVSQIGIKPILIGAMHGLAGSGALTLLILAQIKSTWQGTSLSRSVWCGFDWRDAVDVGFDRAAVRINLTQAHGTASSTTSCGGRVQSRIRLLVRLRLTRHEHTDAIAQPFRCGCFRAHNRAPSSRHWSSHSRPRHARGVASRSRAGRWRLIRAEA